MIETCTVFPCCWYNFYQLPAIPGIGLSQFRERVFNPGPHEVEQQEYNDHLDH